jgi:tetratricopeptide (TPR) repeat protein
MQKPVLAVVLMAVLAGCGSGESPEKYLEKGFVHFQQQEYDKAIESYEKAINAGAKSAGSYNMLGMALRFKFQRTGTPELQEREISAFQKALEVDPKYWVAMVNLGTTYYARGEKAKAAPLFKKALSLNPGHPEKAQLEKMIAEGEGKP